MSIFLVGQRALAAARAQFRRVVGKTLGPALFGLILLTAGAAQAAVPTITSVSPAFDLPAGGASVTITGTGFQTVPVTAVTFGATSASFTITNDTTIQATAPAHAAGVVSISVTNADGTGDTSSSPNDFTYIATPTITGYSTAYTGTGGGVVVLNGTNLQFVTAVSFGGTPGSIIFAPSNFNLIVNAPAHASGTVNVTATNAAGTSDSSGSGDDFTFVPLPTVTGLTPSSGTNNGGTSVVITGTNFIGVTGVKFGAFNAASFNVDSATQITAVSPTAANAGSSPAEVVVTNISGDNSTAGSGNDFTYLGPVYTGGFGGTGSTNGNSSESGITGFNLSDATLTIGGVAAQIVSTSNTDIHYIPGPHAAGTGFTSVITTAGGTAAGPTVDYIAPVTLSGAFSPTTITVGVATPLTFTLSKNDAYTHFSATFSTDLPAGLAVSATPAASNNCSAIFSPSAGDTNLSAVIVSMATGSVTCNFSVNVTSSSWGA